MATYRFYFGSSSTKITTIEQLTQLSSATFTRSYDSLVFDSDIPAFSANNIWNAKYYYIAIPETYTMTDIQPTRIVELEENVILQDYIIVDQYGLKYKIYEATIDVPFTTEDYDYIYSFTVEYSPILENVSNMYIGSQPVKDVYLGDKNIWHNNNITS